VAATGTISPGAGGGGGGTNAAGSPGGGCRVDITRFTRF
jgi:hypothetical protein